MSKANKKKIINDPVHGFIRINHSICFDLMEHPYFQRLRRISQLGLTFLVYPGATHTRFHHAIGAMHLMSTAIDVIRQKGHEITHKESEAVSIAILLHDIGHGPYSHTLEKDIVTNWDHETLSLLYMEKLNKEFNGKLSLAIEIFKNEYHKKFLHQLVSSQLDMDRLDYLRRDSFFTGVSEGVIGSERIIKMLNVMDDQLVVEVKGIYSIEKFLIARRLMYWQVYLHKTVLAAEKMLETCLQRAKDLIKQNIKLEASDALLWFLKNENNSNSDEVLQRFSLLDDSDVMASIKSWTKHSDKILSHLAAGLMNRRLFRVYLQKEAFEASEIDDVKNRVMQYFNLSENDLKYFVFSESIVNTTYSDMNEKINILRRGELTDIAEASDMLSPAALSHDVIKYYICYPKEIEKTLI
ncbi:MAG: HD domain-containing protein [Bacteroidales bacterium]|jgi:HD superfamily phosphohydrolase|nr:HD domain-containing protein [Bacteroidales bacterium]